MKTFLFISGTYRSGTTLVEKLLHQHPNIVMGSQPTPNIFFAIKDAFLKEADITKRYPIDHSFLEERYTNNDFVQYLEEVDLDQALVLKALTNSVAYKGMLTPGFPEYCLENLMKSKNIPSHFSDLYALFLAYLDNFLSPDTDVKIVGAKEILCEEYFSYLLSSGYKVLHIIRDPRDIISSLTRGRGREFMGAIRPALYSLRMWRKSVAYAIYLSSNPNFFFIKYEDLVIKPMETLKKITSWLEMDDFGKNAFTEGILDQFGKQWKGNSSFTNYGVISKDSINKYKVSLPKDVIKYIEAVCQPEIKYLGYETSFPLVASDLWAKLVSGEVIEDKRFPLDYSSSDKNISSEAMRIDYLINQNLSTNNIPKWFMFSEAYQMLGEHLISK